MDKPKHEQVDFTVETINEQERHLALIVEMLGPFYEMYLDIQQRLEEVEDDTWLIYKPVTNVEDGLTNLLRVLRSEYRSAEYDRYPHRIKCYTEDGALWIKRDSGWETTPKAESDARLPEAD